MKTSAEIAQDVLVKRDKRRRSVRSNLITVSSLCLLLIVCVALQPLVGDYNNAVSGSNKITQQYTSYAEVYAGIKKLAAKYSDVQLYYGVTGDFVETDAELKNSSATEKNDEEYSSTNLQVVGVDEADVVKTDGKYIYALSSDYIYIVSANSGALALVSKIPAHTALDDVQYDAVEMFIYGERLIVINNIMEQFDSYYSKYLDGPLYYSEVYYDSNGCCTGAFGFSLSGVKVDVYDISSRESPVLVNSYEQDGAYQTSRLIGDKLYLLTNDTISPPDVKETDISTYIPSYTIGGKTSYLTPEDIHFCGEPESSFYGFGWWRTYLFISGIDISGDVSFVSGQALLGCGSTLYMSTNAIYIASYATWTNDNYSTTNLHCLTVDDGNVTYTAQGSVKGTILNQFSMDEYNGTFRIVTTVHGTVTTNALYTLDKQLNVIGALENIAPDESIYSVRFDGNVAYFVTYRMTDPLFTVDLTDPANPTVLSALKIPGFSEYLHVFSDGRLFGFGRDANNGSWGETLKLSMFDTSDKTDVTEIAKSVLNGVYYSPAEYNHKAILIDSSKNIIAFLAYGSDNTYAYYVYSYTDEGGFKKETVMPLDGISDWNVRGLFIGDYLYVIGGASILSYSMNSYTESDALWLN